MFSRVRRAITKLPQPKLMNKKFKEFSTECYCYCWTEKGNKNKESFLRRWFRRNQRIIRRKFSPILLKVFFLERTLLQNSLNFVNAGEIVDNNSGVVEKFQLENNVRSGFKCTMNTGSSSSTSFVRSFVRLFDNRDGRQARAPGLLPLPRLYKREREK